MAELSETKPRAVVTPAEISHVSPTRAPGPGPGPRSPRPPGRPAARPLGVDTTPRPEHPERPDAAWSTQTTPADCQSRRRRRERGRFRVDSPHGLPRSSGAAEFGNWRGSKRRVRAQKSPPAARRPGRGRESRAMDAFLVAEPRREAARQVFGSRRESLGPRARPLATRARSARPLAAAARRRRARRYPSLVLSAV